MLRRKKEYSPKMLLVILTLICAALLGVSCLYHDAVKPFQNIFASFVIPMQDGINTAGNWVSDNVGSFKTINELEEENKVLSQRVDALTDQNESYKKQLEDLDELNELVKLGQDYDQYETIAANVISSGSGNWFEEFIINKGTKDGILENMNVITQGGLVGIISEAGENYAKVRSIIDDSSNVSAMSSSTSDTCIVMGNQETMSEDSVIEVSHISKNSKMKDGDQLVTSHISSKFLEGLTIGTVKDITVDSGMLTKSAKLVPAVDFEHIKQVLVITQLKEVPEGEETAD